MGCWWGICQLITKSWSGRSWFRCLSEIYSFTSGWWNFRRPICAVSSHFQVIVPSTIDGRSWRYWWSLLLLALTYFRVFLGPYWGFSWFWSHASQSTNLLRGNRSFNLVSKSLPHEWHIFMRSLDFLWLTVDEIAVIEIIVSHCLLVKTAKIVIINGDIVIV